jgi:lipoyl(octanoyl) transferase
VDYEAAWNLQRKLAQERAEERIPDTVLFLEHPPTYTLGRRTRESHLLVPRMELAREGLAVFDVDRGGDITFHGPGQLVGYPILSLKGREGGPGRYLRALEEVIITALRGFGIEAERLQGFTGVWVQGEKVAAIGVKISAHRVTMHGFALNVSTDLDFYSRIIPCGIRDKGITSLERLLGRPVSLAEATDRVMESLGQVMNFRMALVE